MRTVTMDTSGGQHIDTAMRKAKETAISGETEVQFEFNGCTITVRSDSELTLLQRDFSRAMAGYHSDPIGPYPPATLSEATKTRDAEIEAENATKRAKSQAEYARETSERKAAADAEIASVPMEFSDKAKWDTFVEKNDDPYGGAVVTYAERWARIMQARMAGGTDLEAVAEKASHDADVEGITGFMYGCAVSTLARTWIHGERLRRWHNKDTQIGREGDRANESGGVLNPALWVVPALVPADE